jgi:hypothetical protein
MEVGRTRRMMDEKDFEGTLVLESLAEIAEVEAFLEAVDSDDFREAARLMRKAHCDAATIALVLRKMAASENS